MIEMKRSGKIWRWLVYRCCFAVAGGRQLREKKTLLMAWRSDERVASALLFGRRWEKELGLRRRWKSWPRERGQSDALRFV